MTETFNCPSCGAPLETDGKEISIHCEYCGETVIVPQNLRTAAPTSSAPIQFQAPSDQPGQPGNGGNRMAPSQVRQMMMSIRSGRMEDAAQIFQQGTGVSEDAARDTIGMIASTIDGTNRILPAQLAAMMMGAMVQSTRGLNQTYPPVVAPQRRRRRSGLGCLLVLVALVAALYLGYTALSPQQILSSVLSGNKNNTVRQTAMAPIYKIETAVATSIESNQSGDTGPSGLNIQSGALSIIQKAVMGTPFPGMANQSPGGNSMK